MSIGSTKKDQNPPSFIAADEPAAAAAGRSMLEQGGSAMDAAAAAILMMSVTLPSRVGLAGGGVCVVYNAAAKTTRTLDFLPRGNGPVAGPALLRGIYALHASGGNLRWERVVSVAERAAANTTISRAFARDIAASAGRLDTAAQRVFLPGGKQAVEGAAIVQGELAALLSQARQTGLMPLYGTVASESLAPGFGLDAAAIRNTKPEWRETASVDLGSDTIHFANLPERGSGKVLAEAGKAAEEADSSERRSRAMAVLAAARSGGDEAPAAGVVAVDGSQSSVACALTMGAPFGTGKLVPGTGMLAAVPVHSGGFGAPALQTNGTVSRTSFAAVGAAEGNDGSMAAGIALFEAALPAVIDDAAAPDILAKRTAATPGRVDLITCKRDVWGETGRICEPLADPRSFGAAFTILPNQ